MFFEGMKLFKNSAENLNRRRDNLYWYVNVYDDGIEDSYAVLNVVRLDCLATDSHDTP